MKLCTSCGNLLPVGDFPIRKGVTRHNARGTCISCKKVKKDSYREANKEHLAEKQAIYQRDSEKVKAYQAEYFQRNKEKNYAAAKRWRDRNPEKQKQILQDDYLARKHEWPAYVAKRRAKLLQAIPAWADLEKIKSVYEECPAGMHVDHIIPLQGKTVSGLHVHNNLQYLTPVENMRKGNRL